MLAEDTSNVSWEVFRWAVGIIIAAALAVVGWVLKLKTDNDAVVKDLDNRIDDHSTRIAVIENNQENIERSLSELKTDGKERTQMLQQLLGRQNRG